MNKGTTALPRWMEGLQVAPPPAHVVKEMEYARVQAEAAKLKMDEGEPGGRYQLPDGTFVDANGRVLEGRDEGADVATRGTHADLAPAAPAGG